MSSMQALKAGPAPVLMLLGGCFLLGWDARKPPPPGQTKEAVPPAPSQYPYGPLDSVPEGAWVRYEIPGGELVLRLVRRTDTERVVEIERSIGDQREHLLQRVAPDGRVLESYWLSDRTRPVRQRLEMIPPGRPPERRYEPFEKRRGERRISGRTIQVVVVRRAYFDIDGFLQEEVYVSSADVPPLRTRTGSGAVDRQLEGGIVEMPVEGGRILLRDFGLDAKPSVVPFPWE